MYGRSCVGTTTDHLSAGSSPIPRSAFYRLRAEPFSVCAKSGLPAPPVLNLMFRPAALEMLLHCYTMKSPDTASGRQPDPMS